jgi:5-methylcytosine-specific restriction protein A
MANGSGMRREFSAKIKALAFQRANGRCEECGYRLTVGKYHYDHRIPDGLTGSNDLGNCAVVCVSCHSSKTSRDVGQIAKAKRMQASHIGAKQSRNPLPGGRASKWKRKLSGQWVRR